MSAQTQTSLTRKPSSESDKRSPFAALSDVQDDLRRLPEVQLKELVLVAGDYPILLTTTVRNVVGLSAVGAWNLDTPTTVAYSGGIAWEQGGEAGEIKINGFQSLTSGTSYRVMLEIKGKR